MDKKLVLFGAGKIGRSFIAQLFSRGGYEVVFVDISKDIVDTLNHRRSYRVVIKGEIEEILIVNNVRGVWTENLNEVIEVIVSADIMAISIGQNGFQLAISLIAKGLVKRYEKIPDNPVDLIIAENLRNAADFFGAELSKILPDDFPLTSYLGLIETSIGKMVPIMTRKDMEEDILQVFAEPYNTLILDKKAFKTQVPIIEGLAAKDNMKAWVDRKLFVHNLGHATAAYLGNWYNPGFKYLYEAMEIPYVLNNTKQTMLQASDLLLSKYPGEFTFESLSGHVDDLISRFRNRALGDTIFRVGCDLKRKLSSDDRLAGAIHLAVELNKPYDLILEALVCGFLFRAKDENGKSFPGDEASFQWIDAGIEKPLVEICKIQDPEIIRKAAIILEHFKKSS